MNPLVGSAMLINLGLAKTSTFSWFLQVLAPAFIILITLTVFEFAISFFFSLISLGLGKLGFARGQDKEDGDDIFQGHPTRVTVSRTSSWTEP